MNSEDDLINVAAKDIGYDRYQDPEQGTKFGRWYAQKTNCSYFANNGVPYCAMAVSYWLDSAGITAAGFPTAGCAIAMNGAKSAGKWHDGVNGISKGAVVVFSWTPGAYNSDHTGIVTDVNGSTISTIEGNTSNGKVMRRERAFKYVQGYIMPDYGSSSSIESSSTEAGVTVDGWWGKETTLAAQKLAGTYADSIVSGQNPYNRWCLEGCVGGWEWTDCSGSALIKNMMRHLKDAGKYYGDIDGIAGQQFASAMIRYFQEHYNSGATIDDKQLDGGGYTIKAFQRMINAGKWF